MKTVKLKLVIDPTNPAVVAALNTLLLVMGGKEGTAAKLAEKPKTEKPAKAEKTPGEGKPTFADPDTVKENSTATDPTPEELAKMEASAAGDPDPGTTAAEEPKEEEVKTLHSLQEIRELLGKKVGTHRELLSAELKKRGAKNISVLDKKHYDEMFDIMTALA